MSTLIEGKRYVFRYGPSDKFWEWLLYDVTGTSRQFMLRFRWGRRGSAGQTKDEYFTDLEYARWKAGVRAREKTDKGYKLDVDVGDGTFKTRPPQPAVKPMPVLVKPIPVSEMVARLAGLPLAARRQARETEPKTEPKTLTAQRRIRLRD